MKTVSIRVVATVGLIVLMAIHLLAGDIPTQGAVKKDQNAIQGTWKVVALEADGQQAPAQIVATLKLTFKGDTLAFTPGEPGFSNYKYKLDPTAKPASFDMTHADGPNLGQTQKGIVFVGR